MQNDYRDWLRTFDGIEDLHEAGKVALDELQQLPAPRAQSLLLPILTEMILIVRRHQSRSVERSTPIRSVYSGETSIERRKRRLEETFALPDGRRVSWAEATEEDHLARIEYLEAHMRGVQRTIDEHRDAIEAIRRHGVSCLAEIEGVA